MNFFKALLFASCYTGGLLGSSNIWSASECEDGALACTETVTVTTGASEKSPTVYKQGGPANAEKEVQSLVERIELDIVNLRFSRPKGANALDKLQKLKELAPEHDYAVNGERYVANGYYKLAQDRFKQSKLKAATALALKGQSLDPESEQITDLLERIQLKTELGRTPDKPVESSSKSRDVFKLVNQIKDDVDNSRLSRPKQNNALQKIKLLRQIDPEHDYAVNGERYVALGYLRLAVEKVDQGDFPSAVDYAQTAQDLYPESKSISAFVTRIQSDSAEAGNDSVNNQSGKLLAASDPLGSTLLEISAQPEKLISKEEPPQSPVANSTAKVEKAASPNSLKRDQLIIDGRSNSVIQNKESRDLKIDTSDQKKDTNVQNKDTRDRKKEVSDQNNDGKKEASDDIDSQTAMVLPRESSNEVLKVVYSKASEAAEDPLPSPEVIRNDGKTNLIIQTQSGTQPLATSESSSRSVWFRIAVIAASLTCLVVFSRFVFQQYKARRQQESPDDKAGVPPSGQTEDAEAKWESKAPLKVGLIALLFLFFGLGSWSMLVEIDGAVIAPGKLQVDTVKQVIQHPRDGVISEILVENGDVVSSGQVVIRLDNSELLSKLTIIEDELLELLADDSRLRSIIEDSAQLTLSQMLIEARASSPEAVNRIINAQQRRLTDSSIALDQQQDLIRKQVLQTGDQIVGVQAQLEAKTDQLKAINNELTDSLAATKAGLIRKSAVYALQKEKALAEGEVGRLKARIGELESKITELELKIVVLPVSTREKAAELLAKIQPVVKKLTEQRRSTLENMKLLDIRTPVSGTIHDSKVFGIRSIVKSAVPIMHVIPSDRPVVLIAKVEGTDVDQIYVGQTASVKFRSFSVRSMPVVFGLVESISADAFTDPTTKKPYFDVVISITEDELLKVGNETIKAGMPVDVFLATQKRTPLRYLTKPLTDYFGRAFKDA